MFSKRMGLKVAAGFCQRLGTGFRAGVDLLRLCEHEAKHGSDRHKEVMRDVTDALREGAPLAKAMIDSGRDYFPPMLIQMVHIGETTGRLERTLLEVADHYDHRIAMKTLFLRGIAWPLIQLVGGIMVVGLMILIIEVMGSGFNPIGLSLSQYTMLVLLLFGTITTGVLAIQYNWFGCHRLYALVYRVPKVGDSLQTIALSRVCWTLSLALDSGMDALRSIKMSLQSTQNNYFACHADDAIATIKGGGTMAEAFAATGIFPDEFLHYIEMAEISGTDAESLGRMAKQYDERAKTAIRVLVGVLTGVIWASVVILLIALIIKMAMSIGGVYSDALKPI